MSTELEPEVWPPARADSEVATREWVDALASGRCDPETFSRAMRERFKSNRNGNWEVLSLLDQYFRRGKIKHEVFQSVNSRLVVSALGATENAAAEVRAVTPTAAPAETHSAGLSTTPSAASATQRSARAPATTRIAPAPELRTAPVLETPRATHAPAALRAAPVPEMPHAAHTPATRRAAPAPAPHEKSPSDRDLAVGDVLRGRYRLVGELDHGGTATVFEAIDEYRLDLPSTDQRVALKVLHAAEQQREFQHLQLLAHPNIVRVHEIDLDGGIAFYSMELLRGAPLQKMLRARSGAALPRPYALAIIRDVGAALSYAHSRGIIHGDLSPANIFLTNDGEVRVFEFGAPHELIEGRSPDVRDDAFAFSCIAYVLLSGRHPFPEHTAAEARMGRLRPTRPPGLSGSQWRALRAGLHWERAKRPTDIGKWLAAFDLQSAAARLPPLSVLTQAPPPRERHLIFAAAAAAAFAVLIVAGYWLLKDDKDPRVTSALSGIGATLARLAPTARAPEPEPVPAPALPRSTPGKPTTRPASSSAAPAAVTTAGPAGPATGGATGAATGGASVAAARPGTARAAVVTDAPPQPPHPQVSHVTATVGPAHIEMADDTIDIPAYERTAHVIVRRKGNNHGDSRFAWWTESGTAKPGVDFVSIPPHGVEFADNEGSVSLNIPLTATPHNRPKSFYVVIGPIDSGATLGARTLTMVTILPPEG